MQLYCRTNLDIGTLAGFLCRIEWSAIKHKLPSAVLDVPYWPLDTEMVSLNFVMVCEIVSQFYSTGFFLVAWCILSSFPTFSVSITLHRIPRMPSFSPKSLLTFDHSEILELRMRLLILKGKRLGFNVWISGKERRLALWRILYSSTIIK